MHEVALAFSEISKRHKKLIVVDVFQIQHRLNWRAGGLRRRSGRRAIPQAAMFEDALDHIGLVPFLNEGDNFHGAAAFRTEQGINYLARTALM